MFANENQSYNATFELSKPHWKSEISPANVTGKGVESFVFLDEGVEHGSICSKNRQHVSVKATECRSMQVEKLSTLRQHYLFR